jgi:hypothetical protein
LKLKTSLNICLSSRLYPNISIEKDLELVVEEREEHDRDIDKYILRKLRIPDSNIEKEMRKKVAIQEELRKKAKGIFMWVVLVVELLNQAYDQGRLNEKIEAVRRKLNEVPSKLDGVFWALLVKENSHKQDTLLMLQWVLFARRPLAPEEFYFAVKAGTETIDLQAWNRSETPMKGILKFIVDASRGLVEVRRSGTWGYRCRSIHPRNSQ